MRVAITGGIADGKTTVCALLAEQGLVTVSADEIVAKLYRNPTIVKRIRASFGDGLMVDGGVSRELLRAIVSDSAEARAKLNTIFHPAVMREILLQTDTDDIAFAELTEPPLTTVCLSRVELGQRTVEALVNNIEKPREEGQEVHIPTHLIKRASTAPPRSN